MNIKSKKEAFLFVLGDIILLYVSLFVTLIIRYVGIPPISTFKNHILPFSIVFILWIFIFYIFGLYEKQIFVDKKKITPVIIRAQIINWVIAIIFFYLSPITQITPKTNLFIYLAVSIVLLVAWRIFAISFISKKQIPICLIGQGEDTYFLKKDLEKNLRGFEVVHFIDLKKQDEIQGLIDQIKQKQIEYVVVDTKDETINQYIQDLYSLMFLGVQFFEVSDLYESLYNRVPLDIVTHGWFLENVKSKPHLMYDFFKGLMDTSIAFVLFVVSLILYPFIFLVIKLEDRGPLIYRDIRVGKDNKIITILKFRSMTVGIVPELGHKKETKVGRLIRKTRLDEIPQLINVLRGDLSLVGPRPEQPKMVQEYVQKVPFYNIRHLIKPGLSGWAQIYHDNHPHHNLDVEATKEKLSYDLFYIKNRSFVLDLIIALKTVKIMISNKGK